MDKDQRPRREASRRPFCFGLMRLMNELMSYSQLRRLTACTVLISLSACANEEAVEPVASYTLEIYEEPTVPYDIVDQSEHQILGLNQQGLLTLDGYALLNANRVEVLKGLSDQGVLTLSLAPDADAQTVDVVRQMPFLAKNFRPDQAFAPAKLSFAQLEQYRKALSNSGQDQLNSETGNLFLGEVADSELDVSVIYLEISDRCFAFLNGEVVSPQELYENSFAALDGFVERSGGTEAILNDHDKLNRFVGVIRTKGDTPWRCVAAAYYGVMAGGWPQIRIEAMSELGSGKPIEHRSS